MRRPYTMLFKADHDKALECDSVSLLVYLALCRIHSDAPPEEKNCFRAGVARIKRHCGLSRRAIQDRLPRLAAEGLIEIKSGRRKDRESDHEENRITLKGSASDALGSARELGMRCARIKKPSIGGKEKENKSPCSAGSTAIAAPAGEGQEDEIDPFGFYNT